MGGKSSPPPAPDYVGAAQAQGTANKDAAIATAQLSNANVFSPYGSQTVSYQNDPTTGNPIPTINQSLSAEQQQLLNSQNAVKMGLANLGQQGIGTVQNVMGTPFSYNGPGVQTSANQNPNLDLSGVAKAPINAGTTALQASMQRLQPTLERQRDQLNTQLRNQGLAQGSEAYTNAMKDQDFRENDLYNQAVSSSLGMDMSANQQGYNQALQSGQYGNNANLQGAQFGNTAQQQALAQALQQYNLPLNQVTAMMSGSQVTNPQFQGYSGSQVGAAPIANATAQQGAFANNLYSNQVAQQNSMNSGLAALGSMGIYAAAMSDRRLKSDIELIGEHPLGIGIYEYDIFGRRERGVMAQEVLSVKPEAVLTHPSGYLMVNYAAL